MTRPAHNPQWESAIYQGFVRHRRFTPKQNEFRYPFFMLLIKLDELPALTKHLWLFGNRIWHWARFKRKDYIGDPTVAISDSVKQKIASRIDCKVETLVGDVYLMGQLRYLGLYFSPLNLYFLKQHGVMRYMLAEVSNTPWNQRHYYVVDLLDAKPHDKAFHVSPFNPMDQTYQWRIKAPDQHQHKSIVHLDIRPTFGASQKVFDATMVLKRIPLNQFQLNRVLIKTPMQTASIVIGIYWQALKLFMRGVPFYSHPSKTKPADAHDKRKDGLSSGTK